MMLTSGDPKICPGANVLHHGILLFITFDLIYNMTVRTKWIFDPSGPPHTPAPRDYIQIPNVFLKSSSIGLSPV